MTVPFSSRRSRSTAACLVLLIIATLTGLPNPRAVGAVTNTFSVTAADVSLPEGDSGLTDFVFVVTVKCSSTALLVGTKQVDFATLDGAAPRAAVAGEDYTETHGTLSFDFGTPPTDTLCSTQ